MGKRVVTPEKVRAAVEAYHACLNRYNVTESYDLPEGVYQQEIRSTAASFSAAMAFCLMPMVVYMTIPGAVSTWICSILPASGVSIQASILYAIIDFKFLNLAGMSVWTPCVMVGANIVEIPLFLFLAVRQYSRHTVS